MEDTEMMETELYELLTEVGPEMWIAKTKVLNLREQDINARIMPKAMFDQAVRNVRERKALEQLPYWPSARTRLKNG